VVFGEATGRPAELELSGGHACGAYEGTPFPPGPPEDAALLTSRHLVVGGAGAGRFYPKMHASAIARIVGISCSGRDSLGLSHRCRLDLAAVRRFGAKKNQ